MSLSPPPCPRLLAIVDVFRLGSDASFKSFHASVLQIGSIYQLTLIRRKYTLAQSFVK